MSTGTDAAHRRALGHRTLHAATGGLVAASVLGAGAATLAAQSAGTATTAAGALGSTSTVTSRGLSTGGSTSTVQPPAATSSAPVTASHGS